MDHRTRLRSGDVATVPVATAMRGSRLPCLPVNRCLHTRAAGVIVVCSQHVLGRVGPPTRHDGLVSARCRLSSAIVAVDRLW